MMTMKECLEKSAQVWCKPFCSRKEMDVDLAKGFAETLFEEVNRDHTEILLRGELADAVRGKLNLSYGAIEDLLARHPRPASPTNADKVESIEDLATRKGFQVSYDETYTLLHNPESDMPSNLNRQFHFERDARAFLTGLDDVTGKGGR